MFGMLNDLAETSKDRKSRTKYQKTYPFNTSKDQENTTNDVICVLDVDVGYNVYEYGETVTMIKWCNHIDDAVEFAVDHARERILNHQG